MPFYRLFITLPASAFMSLKSDLTRDMQGHRKTQAAASAFAARCIGLRRQLRSPSQAAASDEAAQGVCKSPIKRAARGLLRRLYMLCIISFSGQRGYSSGTGRNQFFLSKSLL